MNKGNKYILLLHCVNLDGTTDSFLKSLTLNYDLDKSINVKRLELSLRNKYNCKKVTILTYTKVGDKK